MDQSQDQSGHCCAEQQPHAKRRISRLQHMTVSKVPKAVQQEELVHKLSSAASAFGKLLHDDDDEHMQDVQERPTTAHTAGSPLQNKDIQASPAADAPSSLPRPHGAGAAVSCDDSAQHVPEQQAGATHEGEEEEQQQQQHTPSATHAAKSSTSASSKAAGTDSLECEMPALLSPLPQAPAGTASGQQLAQSQEAAAADTAHMQDHDPSAAGAGVGAATDVSAPAGQAAEAATDADRTAAEMACPAPTAEAESGPGATASGSGVHGAEASTSSASAAAAVASTALPAVRPASMHPEDEDDDDEWEDQAAPLLPEGDAEAAAGMGDEGQEPADSLAERTGPSSRRREQYDDEDEYEELVVQQRQHGSKPGSRTLSDAAQESGAESGRDGGNILMEDDDAANAQTQRLLRESAARNVFGKDFKPQVAPLSSLLGKLQARQAALGAKAATVPTTTAAAGAPPADNQPQPLLSLEQVRAHLEHHSVVHRQRQKQQQQQDGSTAQGAAEVGTTDVAGGDTGGQAGAFPSGAGADDVMELDEDDEDLAFAEDVDDIDDLVVEPATKQQQQQQDAHDLPPETQQVLDELPPLQQRLGVADTAAGAAAVVVGTELPAELDLQLGDADEEGSGQLAGTDSSRQQQQQQPASAGTAAADCKLVDAEAAESEGGSAGAAEGSEEASSDQGSGSGSDEEEGSEDGDDEEEDDPMAGLSVSEEEDEHQQQQEPEVEPEPLNWEEEDQELAGGGSSQQQHEARKQAATGGVKKVNVSRLVAKLRHKAAAYGFIEAEAELSDDEEGLGASDDEDDEDQDGMLEELLADATEGRLDESRRAALHARWADAQEAKQVRELLNAIKNGFRRKRRLGAGLEGDEDEDGTDAEARWRRARLLGLADGDGDEDDAVIGSTDRLKRLDFSWRPEDEVDMDASAAAVAAEQAARQKRQQLHKLTKQAQESQQDGDIMQLLQMDIVDEDSQHTVELLAKSSSLQAPTSTAAAAAADASGGRDTGRAAGSSRGPSNLRHTSGPHTSAASGAAAGESGAAGTAPGAPAAAAAAGAGFSFKMFGKDPGTGGSSGAALQASSSFIGRQASSAVGVRSASNYGASRTFVFGSDPSNYSNHAAGVNSNQGVAQKHQQQQQHAGDSKAAAAGPGAAGSGPSSFAGLGRLIAEAKGAQRGANGVVSNTGSRQAGGGVQGGSSVLLNVLHNKGDSSRGAAPTSNVITAAVGTKLAGAERR